MAALDVVLLYLLSAVLGVALFRLLRLPPILAYLTVGVIIGPNALALAKDMGAIHTLAEFGVLLLMFVIGLEFNLRGLKNNIRHVVGLGSGQVFGTFGVFFALAMGLAWVWPNALWGSLDWRGALALSMALVMSSTAIVGRMMSERKELEAEHGRRVFGVLLFQDLVVAPLLILVPALSSPPEEILKALFFAAIKAVFIVGILLKGGQWVLRSWLRKVAQGKSEELFMLNLLLVTLGLAWVTEMAGLSLALGAFVAGVLISETEFKYRVETEIKPFHDIFLGLFFITIGSLLDWVLVWQNWPTVLLLVLVVLLCKFGVVVLLAYKLGATKGVSVRTALYLAQTGEFGIVLLSLVGKHHVLPPEILNPVLAAVILTMFLAPFMVIHSQTLVLKIATSDWMLQSLQMTEIARKSINVQKHVIICGYGRCGQNLAKLLSKEGIAYIALDTDPDRVEQATAAGDKVVYGDANHQQALMAAGLARATTIVVTYLDSHTRIKAIHNIRIHAPQIHIVVRTLDDTGLDDLYQAGATEIVPETVEGSLMLASQVLVLQGVPVRKVIRTIQEQRSARYALMRGYFHGQTDATVEGLDSEHLRSVTVHQGSFGEGQSLIALALERMEVRVVSVRSAGSDKASHFSGETVLQKGDVVVLSGKPEALIIAEEYLLQEAK